MTCKTNDNADMQANAYARNLAIALHQKHYSDVVWRPLPDTLGLLTQIDNMTCGLVRKDACAKTPPSSGHEETEENLGTGVEPAVRARVWRLAMGLSVAFWLTVTLLGLRGCWG